MNKRNVPQVGIGKIERPTEPSNSKYETGLGIVQQEKEPPSLQSGRYGGWGSRQACGN